MTSKREQSNNPSSEREILPNDLRAHLIEARSEGYAGGGEYVSDDMIPEFKRFKFQDNQRGYYYEDKFGTSEKRPGNFAGFELVTRYPSGPRCAYYGYAGGLTEEGEKLGEKEVYLRLQRFLTENADVVRFGGIVEFSFEDEDGAWTYRAWGGIARWGWEDREEVVNNGKTVYELSGQGVCFLQGY